MTTKRQKEIIEDLEKKIKDPKTPKRDKKFHERIMETKKDPINIKYEKYWKENNPTGQVPVPVTSEWLKEQYDNNKMIQVKDLVDREFYMGRCRNANLAMWDAKRNQFVHVRYKWGDIFSEAIPHVEEDTTYDVFVPWYVAGKDEQRLIDELKEYLKEYEEWMKKLGK